MEAGIMEELLNKPVIYLSHGEAVSRVQGTLIKVDQYGITLEDKQSKKVVIPWQSFSSGGFIKEQ